MRLETTKTPYELLVRWAQDGTVSGAHVQWRYTVKDGGAVVGGQIGAAEPVGMTEGAAGFPLTDILSQAHIAALSSVNALAARVLALEAENSALAARVAELEAS